MKQNRWRSICRCNGTSTRFIQYHGRQLVTNSNKTFIQIEIWIGSICAIVFFIVCLLAWYLTRYFWSKTFAMQKKYVQQYERSEWEERERESIGKQELNDHINIWMPIRNIVVWHLNVSDVLELEKEHWKQPPVLLNVYIMPLDV